MHSRPIYLTNTYGRKLEEFQPLQPGRVTIYSCGPTVYGYQHIGNFRSFIVADLLRRLFEYNGYDVQHVQNITDVGHLTDETLNTGPDKIEAQARARNVTPWDIARHYTEQFLRDSALLKLKEPSARPRATDYIEAMIALTQQLIEKEYGYVSDGNVYYDVSKFPAYGKLSGNSVDDLIAGARVEVGEDKRTPADFALWKAAEPDRLMRWKSPWSEGVPGWHIECSAMSMALLGEQIDVHTGGIDNIFPHHEDEIAQSEAATGKSFARYWVHTAFLQTGGEKMAKSVGNIDTVSDLIARGTHPLAYRYFTFQAHHRTPLNFTYQALEAAQTALERIWEIAADELQSGASATLGKTAIQYQERFHEAVNHDLDLPGALAILHEALGASFGPGQKITLLADFDRVLGLDFIERAKQLSRVSDREQMLLDERATARSARDWARSDELRAELSAEGLEVKDTPRGQRWVRSDLAARVTDESPQDRSQRDPAYTPAEGAEGES